MSVLADRIEQFILEKLFEDQEKNIVVKRNELADELACAPSQITYVLSTRFSNDKGFSVESRRGLGGFIRIAVLAPGHEDVTDFMQRPSRVPVRITQENALEQEILSTVPMDIISADRFIGMLLYNQRISNREARLMHDAFDIVFTYSNNPAPMVQQLFHRFVREVWRD